jgi:hypothetical protein
MLQFLGGQAAFDRLVDMTVPVKRLADGHLQFKSRANGVVDLWLKGGEPVRLEFDNKPALNAAYRFNPIWNSPVDDPLVREDIIIRRNLRMPRGVFSVIPPKGATVRDERTKPK